MDMLNPAFVPHASAERYYYANVPGLRFLRHPRQRGRLEGGEHPQDRHRLHRMDAHRCRARLRVERLQEAACWGRQVKRWELVLAQYRYQNHMLEYHPEVAPDWLPACRMWRSENFV